MSIMQPKWFRRLDLAVGHVVWAVDNDVVRGGKVLMIDNDDRYNVVTDEGSTLSAVRSCLGEAVLEVATSSKFEHSSCGSRPR